MKIKKYMAVALTAVFMVAPVSTIRGADEIPVEDLQKIEWEDHTYQVIHEALT